VVAAFWWISFRQVSARQSESRGARRTGFHFPPIDEARGFDAVEALALVAKQRGATVAQVALAWLLAQPGVTSIIIGANKMEQLEDNLKAADLQLSTEEVGQLSSTTAPVPLYPAWMIERQNQGRQGPQPRGARNLTGGQEDSASGKVNKHEATNASAASGR
jgi:hypothetical protein